MRQQSQYNYDPMGQAAQMLQVLGQRRAQEQGNEIDWQRLAQAQAQMEQQGGQFDRGIDLDERRMTQQGSQFDRNFDQQAATQRYTEERQARMDPLAMAQQIAQTRGLDIANEQAPARFGMDQGRYAMENARVPLAAQELQLRQQALQQDQLSQEFEMLKQVFPDVVSPDGLSMQINPQLLQWLQQKGYGQGAPQAPVNNGEF